MRTRFLSLLAALALSACDLLGNTEAVDFQMMVREVESHGPDGPSVTARVQHGWIIVTGGITTQCEENEPTGDILMPNRSQIDVIIIEQRFDTTCTPRERFFTYDAFIQSLERRRFLVNVIHRPLGGQQVTVFSEHIDVN